MTQDASAFDDMPTDARALDRWLLSDGRLDLLRSRLVLSDIIGCTVDLQAADHGEKRGPCPAADHEDQDMSFFVSDRQGVFHCFGCGIHGDAIRWMTGSRGMQFVDAVRRLARDAGLLRDERGASPDR